MRVIVYGIANCDKVRSARRWLDAHGIEYIFHDYKKAGVDEAILARWCHTCGWQALLNRRGSTWRHLPAASKMVADEDRAIALMRAQPSLIKRPLVEADADLILGFDPQRYAALLQR